MSELLNKINDLKTELASYHDNENFPDWCKSILNAIAEILEDVHVKFTSLNEMSESKIATQGIVIDLLVHENKRLNNTVKKLVADAEDQANYSRRNSLGGGGAIRTYGAIRT